MGVEETLREVTQDADVVVVAVGIPQLVRGDWVKPGAVVLDVGINVVAADAVGGDGGVLHCQKRQLYDVREGEAAGQLPAAQQEAG